MGGDMKRKKAKKRREIGFLHNAGLWWRKAGRKKRAILSLSAVIIVMLGAAGIYYGLTGESSAPALSDELATVSATPVPAETPRPAEPAVKAEDEIYSYFQGPKTWGKRLKWSGEWGVTYYDGASFGGFGCGLCCVANVYSSLTKYQCTPIDAYRYAKKHTEYQGGGAIDWGYMRTSLSMMGFDCKVYKKPKSYEKFKRQIKKSQAAIVLVSSSNSTCYWKDTPGHYVTMFLYDEKSDKVFLADSGDPKHNRHWVPLKKIYDSLKTASAWQFLSVKGYQENMDQWKHKKAKGNWIKE